MKCDKCHINEATVFITQTVNGETLEKNLCESCAEEENQQMFEDGLSFQQFLTGFIDGKSNNDKDEVVVCPGCGMTLMDFKRYSKVGCAQCYITFYSHLQPIIKKLHGTAQHTGKFPRRIGAKYQVQKKMTNLESQLKVALLSEDYEKAVLLRDEIRDLKKEENL